jgi:hypothetical protein
VFAIQFVAFAIIENRMINKSYIAATVRVIENRSAVISVLSIKFKEVIKLNAFILIFR